MWETKILITGGAGFIGTHLTKHFVRKYPTYLLVNLDKLTYAGNLENLKDIENCSNYEFVKGDILDLDLLRTLFQQYRFDAVLHCAAESHVDRSISEPLGFVKTNVVGTATLLQVARENWNGQYNGKTFYQISTDEVYGSLGDEGLFSESTAYDPRSPYSASKAGADHLVRAYFHTFDLPIKISNCSNNYGPYQFPEKLIPLFINNIRLQQPLPVYGKGLNIRDWLYVGDHVEAIDLILHRGKIGQTYNVGGHNEWRNIDLIRKLCQLMDGKLGRPAGTSEQLITFVKDRAGHDFRYAIDTEKITSQLGWRPRFTFEQRLSETIDWYLANHTWLDHVTSGEYLHYYEKQYGLSNNKN